MSPTTNSSDPDFTEVGCREILRAAKERYRFEPYGTDCAEPHLIWRHDIDVSMQRALRIAQIEAEEDVTTTYFFLLHSFFYNLLEPAVTEQAKRILALGHGLGLHFETGAYPEIDSLDSLGEKVAFEAGLLEEIFGVQVSAFSFHDPEAANDLVHDNDEIGGLINTYGKTLRERYEYVSDSNGRWRFRPLREVIGSGEHERLHVLTHPVWWQAEAMPPRQRIERSVEGRAKATMHLYDSLVRREEPGNVG